MGLRGPSSPYLATLDLLRRWPKTGPRRSIILISSGFDYFRGASSGPTFPDVVPLTRLAQTQNTNIWAVYFPSATHRGRSFNYAWTGQNNLSRVADETGGELFALGIGMPVSLKPHFDQIFTHSPQPVPPDLRGRAREEGAARARGREDRGARRGVLHPRRRVRARGEVSGRPC